MVVLLQYLHHQLGYPSTKEWVLLLKQSKPKLLLPQGGGVSKLDATLELVNTTASGYDYREIPLNTPEPIVGSIYPNSSTRIYYLKPREYYGGEVETYTFRYNGDADRIWLVPIRYASVDLNRVYTGYSVVPSSYSNEYYAYVDNGTANLELKRTAEDTYVLTLTAKSVYGGVTTSYYLLIFPETDNYKEIAVYIYVNADE